MAKGKGQILGVTEEGGEYSVEWDLAAFGHDAESLGEFLGMLTLEAIQEMAEMTDTDLEEVGAEVFDALTATVDEGLAGDEDDDVDDWLDSDWDDDDTVDEDADGEEDA